MNQSCSWGTLLYGTGWRKRTDTQDKAGHLRVSAGCELSSSHQTSGSGADLIHKPPSEKEQEKDFAQRAVSSADQRITQGKMGQEVLFVSWLYQFPGVSTPEDKHTEIVRVTGDAPGNGCPW